MFLAIAAGLTTPLVLDDDLDTPDVVRVALNRAIEVFDRFECLGLGLLRGSVGVTPHLI
jgi:hypothetical protein